MHNYLIAIFLLVSCGGTKFSGTSKNRGASENPGANAEPMKEESLPKPSDSSTLPDPISSAEAERCWFAVSGSYYGHSVLDGHPLPNTAFPVTMSGRPIAGGETFDANNGVFLNARATPYEYQKGGRELDGAVDKTFDSIAVAPGMTVEIRDKNGNEIYKGDGPMLGLSYAWGNDFINGLKTSLKARADKMPQWMKAKLESQNYVIPAINNLTNGVWVKVSKIPGAACE